MEASTETLNYLVSNLIWKCWQLEPLVYVFIILENSGFMLSVSSAAVDIGFRCSHCTFPYAVLPSEYTENKNNNKLKCGFITIYSPYSLYIPSNISFMVFQLSNERKDNYRNPLFW